MPWKSVSILESRLEFIRLFEHGGVSMAELCRRYGVSRQTGYAYVRRYRAEGASGLADRSRRPLSSPRRSVLSIEALIVEVRQAHPAWGGRKIARRLRDMGALGVPAPSTVTEVLRRHDLLDPAQAVKHRAFTRFERGAPNELWQMDFKGHIATDRGRCHPLTVLDDHSRYALGLRACDNETSQTVTGCLTSIFRHYGLPQAMLADNGTPWGTGHTGGYTGFEIWLMRLGIRLLHGRPYHPQTQGKEERFHRTLKLEVLQSRQFADNPACQRAFDDWRHIYNHVRPHEALNLDVPISRYRPSPTAMPARLPEPQYYETDLIRRVSRDGIAKFKNHQVQVGQAFTGLDVAFRATKHDNTWSLYFMQTKLAQIDLSQPSSYSTTVRYVSEHLSGMSPV